MHDDKNTGENKKNRPCFKNKTEMYRNLSFLKKSFYFKANARGTHSTVVYFK